MQARSKQYEKRIDMSARTSLKNSLWMIVGLTCIVKWVVSDPVMPKNIAGRRKHCFLMILQGSPSVLPHNNDN